MKTFFQTLLTAVFMLCASISMLSAKEIKVILQYESGRVCRNECVKNDYNGKEACVDSDGVALLDVGDASGKVTIYVGGKSAGCARAGETITIIVKNTTYSVEPVNPRGC
jgi:hypothetical protein